MTLSRSALGCSVLAGAAIAAAIALGWACPTVVASPRERPLRTPIASERSAWPSGVPLLLAHYDPAVMAALDRAIQLNPDDATAYQSRAQLWMHVEEYAKAIEDLSTVLRLEPDNSEAYNYRGTALFWAGDYAAALADFDRALRLNAGLMLARFNRGYANLQLGAWQQAIADFQAGAELAKADGNREAYDEAQRTIAEIRAIPHLSTAALFARGQEQLNSGDYLSALASFTYVLAREPQRLEAYLQRGLARTALGAYAGAIADFNRAIQLDPNNAEAYNQRGNALILQGDLPQAIASFDQAIAVAPDSAPAYYYRGLAQAELEHFEQALADFTQAIAQQPDWADVYGSRGLVYFQQGRPESARADLERAAELFAAQNNPQGYEQTLIYLDMVREGTNPPSR